MSQSKALKTRANATPVAWDLLASFLAVMRAGSLSGAARALGLAQPTIRRHVEELERALGAVLFTRSPTGLAATDAARVALSYAESMSGVADALVRAVSAPGGASEGTVRVTSSEIVGIEVLPPMFATLARRHPRLEIELSVTNTNEDLLRRDADIAVRMAAPEQGALVAKRAGTIAVGLFATEGYLAEHPAPKTPSDLVRGHALVGRDRDAAFFEALASAGVRAKRRDFLFRSDSDAAQLGAVRAGLGIGICQLGIAKRTKGLVRVLPKIGFGLPTWVVTHEDLRSSKRVSIVFDHLVKELAAYA